MSIKLYATHLCIPRIQNYNGVCTNDFLQPPNNLQPPKQVVDGCVGPEAFHSSFDDD